MISSIPIQDVIDLLNEAIDKCHTDHAVEHGLDQEQTREMASLLEDVMESVEITRNDLDGIGYEIERATDQIRSLL